MVTIDGVWTRSDIVALSKGPFRAALLRALRKAGSTALRDMRSEASKRIRQRKRIRIPYIARALSIARTGGSEVTSMAWALNVAGEPVPLVAYPHRQGKRGVTVEVNRGKRTLVKSAFVATMRSGHKGVFRRSGTARLPIEELRGSRPVDALLHRGESDAVAERGGESFGRTFTRLLPLEIGK
jgi:hypothetical protein